MPTDLDILCISPTTTIREAIARIDRGEKSIILVTDAERHLFGTITDGDVRRMILAGQSLEQPVSELLAAKAQSPYPKPVTAKNGTSPLELIQIMQERVIRQIPLLDDDERVVDLVCWDDLLPTQDLPLHAVIMAGGYGKRLRPLTEDLPKPMLPIGGRPLMERIIGQLKDVGIRQVNVTTLYKPEKIKDYFGNGEAFGINLNYIHEAEPLGTGGALGLLPTPEEPMLVINGDILTQVDFRAMLDYHKEHKADMTVAVRQFSLQVPYGVVECEGPMIRDLKEKPELTFFVNAGIYLLDPPVFKFIPSGEKFNMTDLIQWLLDAGRTVVSFPVREYWLDIGQSSDYEQAQMDIENGRLKS